MTAISLAENNGMHDAARQQRERTGHNQRADKERDHRRPVPRDGVAARMQHADGKHDQGENRQHVY